MAEIDFDAITDAAERAARIISVDEIVALKKQIARLKAECGTCVKWMTRGCPREVHNSHTGRHTGPSCSTHACREFVLCSQWEQIIGEKEEELQGRIKAL